MIANPAPCGSMIAAKRPIGIDTGSWSTVPPSSCAFSTAASQSFTAKHTFQKDGTSGGNCSSLICIMPPTGWPSRIQTT